MELLQLKYFVVTAKHNNITKAAEELGVSQPTVSQAIARLESELGVKLFDRAGKKIALNIYGQVLLKSAGTILTELETSVEMLHILKKTSVRPLVIQTRFQSSLYMEMLQAFLQRYPYFKFDLSSPSFDLRISMGEDDHIAQGHSEVILQEAMLLVVPVGHPFAALESVLLTAAKDEPFILPTPSTPERAMMLSFCKRAGFSPNIVYEYNNMETLRRMLSLGVGIGFLGTQTGFPTETEHYVSVRIDSPVCISTVRLSWPEKRELSQSAQLFRGFVKEYLQAQRVSPG